MLQSRNSKTGGQIIRNSDVAKANQSDLEFLKELLEAGKLVSVIDRVYPLSEVAEAIRYLEEGHVRGKVVISLEHINKT
jgi:NADPH:quinone reductase-like Zn-dependent oxidoreductase